MCGCRYSGDRRGASFQGRFCRKVGSLNFSKAPSQLVVHLDAKPSCPGMPNKQYSCLGASGTGAALGLTSSPWGWYIGQG